jgi:uncharacterized protein (TIGR03435 family)
LSLHLKLFSLLCLLLPAIAAHAQSTQPVPVPAWQVAAGGKQEFDVASVKLAPPSMSDRSSYRSSVPLAFGLDGPTTNGLFTANAPLNVYILFAYKITDSNEARNFFFSLPAWAKYPHFFTIEARAPGSPTRDQLRLMMQSLLADRFQLAVHREMQVHDLYAFSLVNPGKPGLQLQPHPAGKPCIDNPEQINIIDTPPPEDSPRSCGPIYWRDQGVVHLRLTNMSMADIAEFLAGTGTTLAGDALTTLSGIDATGLTGRFDLDLQFVPELNGQTTSDVAGPNFTEALRKQLGLKLSERKGPVEVLVIDHIEKPSAN